MVISFLFVLSMVNEYESIRACNSKFPGAPVKISYHTEFGPYLWAAAMPGPGPHLMYAMGSGLALTRLSHGRFSPHHTLTYTINAFFGPDIGSFSLWLGSFFTHSFGSSLADAIHDPFYYSLILGFPLCVLYSWLSKVLLHKGLLDSVSGVSLLNSIRE